MAAAEDAAGRPLRSARTALLDGAGAGAPASAPLRWLDRVMERLAGSRRPAPVG